MKYLILFLSLFACAHKDATPKDKLIFVDMKTYMEWGTTKMVPIGRRAIPSEADICKNPLWIEACYKDRYLRQKYFNGQ